MYQLILMSVEGSGGATLPYFFYGNKFTVFNKSTLHLNVFKLNNVKFMDKPASKCLTGKMSNDKLIFLSGGEY